MTVGWASVLSLERAVRRVRWGRPVASRRFKEVMAERVASLEPTAANRCPSCRRFHAGPKHYRPLLRLIHGGKKETLISAR